MQLLHDTQSIFQQLASLEPCGVKTIIENHDSADHAAAIEAALTAALRIRFSRNPARDARIESQRRSLLPLLTTLKKPLASAG